MQHSVQLFSQAVALQLYQQMIPICSLMIYQQGGVTINANHILVKVMLSQLIIIINSLQSDPIAPPAYPAALLLNTVTVVELSSKVP